MNFFIPLGRIRNHRPHFLIYRLGWGGKGDKKDEAKKGAEVFLKNLLTFLKNLLY